MISSSPSSARRATEAYSFDDVGNRLSSVGLSPYQYNSSNQLTSTPNATFTFDDNGNTLTKADTNGTTQYAWDFENRLTSVTLPNDGGTVYFKYDPFGRRIQKSGPSGTVNYAYDGANAIEEVNSSGAVIARYVQGAGIDEPLAQSRSGLSFYQADGLGSITALADSSGTILASYTYDAFGNVTASTGSNGNPYRYTGRDYDSETGLYYYRARYYDAVLGRFISADPIANNAGGTNFYSYVGNSPTVFFDPTGLAAWVAKNGWTAKAKRDYSSFAAAYVKSYKGEIDCADLALMTLIAYASTNGLPLHLKYFAHGHWSSYDAQSDDFTSVEQYTETVTTNMGAINVIDNTHPIKPAELAPGDLLMSRHRGPGYTGHTRIVTGISCNKCNGDPEVTWLQGNLPPVVPQERKGTLSSVPGDTLSKDQIPRRWNFDNW